MRDGSIKHQASAIAGAVPTLLIALCALGCATTDTETFRENRYLGKYWHDHGRFGEAASRFKAALEEKPEDPDSLIGLGNSAAEYSHQLYEQAEDSRSAQKQDLTFKLQAEADGWANLSNLSFTKALKNSPGDLRANYGLGLMLFKRSTSTRNLPYPSSPDVPPEYQGTAFEAKWLEGVEQRRKELDETIRQFGLVLAGDAPDPTGVPHVRLCRSVHAHRYLGLALFLRSDWERADGNTARTHLTAYLVAVQQLREFSIRSMPASTPEEKQAKDKELKRLEAELIDVKTLIRQRLEALREYETRLRAKKESPPLPVAEHDKRLASVAVEIDAVSALVSAFDRVAGSPDGPRRP